MQWMIDDIIKNRPGSVALAARLRRGLCALHGGVGAADRYGKSVIDGCAIISQ